MLGWVSHSLCVFQVVVDMSVPPSPVCQSVEMGVHLGQSDLSCSSFLSLPGGPDPLGLGGDTPSSVRVQTLTRVNACTYTDSQESQKELCKL